MLFSFPTPPLLVRTAQDALYSTENSHRSHPIMKLMTCYGEFRILVWWGEFVDILDCWLPFPYTDVTFEESGAIDVGCSHWTTVKSIGSTCFLFAQGTKIFKCYHRFHFSVTRESSTFQFVWNEWIENIGIWKNAWKKVSTVIKLRKEKLYEKKIGGNVWSIEICNTWLIKGT